MVPDAASRAQSDALRQHSLQQHQRRPDQERRVDVGILEQAARAVAGRQHILGAGKGVEIAGHADQCGDHGGEDIGRAQRGKPRHRVLGEQASPQDGGHRQIDRRGGVLDRLFLFDNVEQGQHAADIPDQQQKKQRRDLAADVHAGNQGGQRQHRDQRVMRRGLDEGDRAGQHGQEEHDEQQPLAERCNHRRIGGCAVPARSSRRGLRDRHVSGGDQ